LELNAGPVPPRVDETAKAGLLDLVDHAMVAGWSARRAADLLDLDHVRFGRWQARRDAGELVGFQNSATRADLRL
jgi:putative transposase